MTVLKVITRLKDNLKRTILIYLNFLLAFKIRRSNKPKKSLLLQQMAENLLHGTLRTRCSDELYTHLSSIIVAHYELVGSALGHVMSLDDVIQVVGADESTEPVEAAYLQSSTLSGSPNRRQPSLMRVSSVATSIEMP